MKTPRDPSTAQRRRSRRRTTTIAVAILSVSLLLSVGGYVMGAANATLPAPRIELDPEAARTVTADPAPAQAAIDAQTLPTAIGWLHEDEVWTNDETPYPLGSIAKLITILVCMDHKPLEPGAEGETYTWTAEDAARTDDYLAVDGVAYSIPVGTQLTQRDMLKFIFLPSANDYAHAYALWTFGSNEAYLAALEAWKQQHGLTSITFDEPTGMSANDRASAADLVRVARLALQNPTVAEFNAMQTAEMPWGVGTIENSNPLLGEVPGVIGTKTGTLDAVGYNFIVSQVVDVHGREAVSISAALARPSKYARADAGREMLGVMAALPQHIEFVAEGETVGTAITATGERIPLVTTAAAGAVLIPGEEAVRTVEFDEDFSGDDPAGNVEAGEVVGTVRVAAPTGEVEVPVALAEEIVEPDLWWRLQNPRVVFG